MLNKVVASVFVSLGLFSFAQNKSVDALKGSQEIRKKYIETPTVNSKSLSKSLFVDPFIGTGGHGHTYPGASAPFGMMQLSPDTRYEGWDGCSGYHYSDSIIYGFSHTHLSGTGVPDYCDLLLVPQNGVPKTVPGYKDPKGYGSRFSHEQENASPGYYEVKLLDPQINVRLTVSDRSGMHEYTFLNKKGKKFILIDLDHRDKLLGYSLNIINKTTIEGSRISESWATNQRFYFHLETSVPYQKAKLFKKNGQHKLLLTFSEKTEQILVKVGMSAVDEKGANQNLQQEIPHWNFDQLRAETVKKWNNELGKINFQTSDRAAMINFYTALYHTYLNPNLFTDVDGRYRGRGDHINYLSKNDAPQYTVFSLWDTYRATHPLFTITQQKRTNAFVQTFMRQYMQGFDLPVWELAGNETDCMIGYHSVSVIADAYIKGIATLDSLHAMKAMIYTSDLNELGKQYFSTNGFISASQEPESVSKTLEYAYDDFCIAQFAKYTNQPDVHDVYMKRSMNFINVFDPQSKFMRARRGGMWFSPFDPAEVNFNYTEANSWQYSLAAPHAVGVLSKLIGGKDSLETWLDRLFSAPSDLSGRHQVDITGLIGQYAHGNEPSHHMAYLYNYTNAPEKTQLYVDRILKEMYSPTPDGLSGNEDCGQMSAWYVLSAMGFYQVTPASPYYDFGRPIMDEASLELENGKTFVIKTKNNNPENKYIQEVTLNGKSLNRSYIHHKELMEGGILEFTMGKSPNLDRDKFSAAPSIEKAPDNFIAVPYFEQESKTFEEKMEISMNYPKYSTNLKDFALEYSFDGTKWEKYTTPLTISQTTTVYGRLTASNKIGNKVISPSIENTFVKRDPGVHLTIVSSYANQYAAGGETALIDGVRGGKEFRTGDWQGYWAQDLVAEVSFDTPRQLKEIGISCVKDMKSWIFFPKAIDLSISYDGVTFFPLTTISAEKPTPDLQFPDLAEYIGETKTTQAIKAFRVTAKNYGKCPEWHLGAGNDTWLFADEIIFR